MPITVTYPIKLLSEREFHQLDFHVMRLAFEAHNQLGRFYNEEIYKNKLVELCKNEGLDARTEVKIELTHGQFHKNLFIDTVIDSASIYELKTARAIDAAHRAQALGYLFLANIQHGKIINFRPPSVEHEFVSTSLTLPERRKISIDDKNWKHNSSTAKKLKAIVIDLLNDWGAFLDTDLYKEAIRSLFSPAKEISHPVEIKSGSLLLGKQNLPLISPTETFTVSSIRNGISTYQTHLHRFLKHTRLTHLHWINIDNFNVQFTTISNKNYSDLNYSD